MKVYDLADRRTARRTGGRRFVNGPAHLRPKLVNLAPELTLDLVDICDACARPIEGGAVLRGEAAFCSVECSLDNVRFAPAG